MKTFPKIIYVTICNADNDPYFEVNTSADAAEQSDHNGTVAQYRIEQQGLICREVSIRWNEPKLSSKRR